MAKSKEVIDYSINISANTGDVNKLNESLTKTDKAVDQLEASTKSLKVQLREATLEQQKLSAAFGATSTQAIAAAKNVANIKDEIEFQKDLVKSYNPDEKFRKLTQTAGVAALALGGVKDGFTALGIESKTLDKIIGSAQAILGVTAAVSGMSDAYAVLTASKKAKATADLVEVGTTTAVTTAEVTETAAVEANTVAWYANPIMWIAATVVAVGVAIYSVTKYLSSQNDELARAEVMNRLYLKSIENETKALIENQKYQKDRQDYYLSLMNARGASSEAIEKETKRLDDQNVVKAKSNQLDTIKDLIDQRRRAKAFEGVDETKADTANKAVKLLEEQLKAATDIYRDAYDSRKEHQQDFEVAKAQAATDARLKAEQEAEKARQKELDAIREFNKKKLEEEAKAAADLLAFKATVSNAEIERKTEAYQADRDNIKRQDEEIAAYEEQQANNEIEFEKRTSEEKQRIGQIEFEHKRDLSFSLVNLGQMLIDLFSSQDAKTNAQKKKNIHINHAIALGDIGLNTARAVMAETAKGIPISIPLIAADIAMGVVQTGAAIASTNKALKAVGGGSADSGSSAGSASALNIAPQIGFQNSSENQIATSISKSNAEQKVNVTVLASDITDVQNNLATNVVQNSF